MTRGLVKPPFILRKFYYSLVWSIPSVEKVIYLTFDDGPIPEVTPWVLEQLNKYNGTATFFCIGDNIRKHPAVFEQVIKGGHAIGNHTYNHLNGWKTSAVEYVDNVIKCSETMQTKLFRPPYGRITRTQIKNLKSKFRIIMWDILSYDFDSLVTPEQCLKNVINNTRSGSVILFHDSIKAQRNLYYALPQVLRHFSKLGFVFRKIE